MPMETFGREPRDETGRSLGEPPSHSEASFAQSNNKYSKESETKERGVAMEVISLLVRLAVEDTPGAYLAEEPYVGGWVYRLWGRPAGPAVQLRREDGRLSVFVRLAVDYGADIRSVAREVQRRVREDVERLTGYVPDAVDVFVEDVRERKARPPEPTAQGEGRSAGNPTESGDRQGDADLPEAQYEGRSSVADKG
ncbi:Asp23/Gls24 family envelope stress response protein [Brockia lithotrophica]|uniref:Putative alkaline shock family protein YloU n=1 Tax=Brockia lithotrophica TaxID=933949 RepID=A0A660L3F0_9BACL|nr:Asp23/Gls24 family envelope stress response protein [Brockia lithotrophica]RKQ88467.1 putative alkaline shock family protein YloU [Brockia lithotrophica]